MNLVSPEDPLAVFFALAVVHALADFPLQGDYLARHKVRRSADSFATWLVALSAHALIHAGGVWLVTGSKLLGLVELVLHALIDGLKGKGCFGLLPDQGLHLGCKIAYACILYYGWVR